MKLQMPFEVKAVNEKEIEGHGSVFGNVDLGGDVVIPGAFQRTIKEHKANGTMPAMLWQHNSEEPIGVWSEMHEDERGLYMKGELADTVLGRDARTLLKMGAIQGLSIGYATKDADYDKDGNRILKEVELWETSVVTFPMNPKAIVAAVKADPRALERSLRDAGFSRAEAKRAIHQCDADEDQLSEDELLVKQLRELREQTEARQLANHIRRLNKHG